MTVLGIDAAIGLGIVIGWGLPRVWSVYRQNREHRAMLRGIGPPLTLAEMRTLKDGLHHKNKYGYWEIP